MTDAPGKKSLIVLIRLFFKRTIRFIKHDIWYIPLKQLHWTKTLLVKSLRIVLLALREFGEDKCHLRASALTFYSLLSIVPMVAMAFGVAKGFGLDKVLEEQIVTQLSGQEEVAMKIINFARSLLEETKGGLIAGIGIMILFFTIFKVLAHIAHSFNDIRGVKSPRNIGRRIGDYLAIMVVCPLLFIMSSTVTVFLETQVAQLTQKVELIGTISPILFRVLKLVSLYVIWTLFSFIYIFVPNTKVNLSSGILAGLVAGSMYQMVNWSYIKFQVGAAKYGAIYGSFAALPLFLIWLQLSWLIVLFGAEICFGHQNVETYQLEPASQRASFSFKKLLALTITHLVVSKFQRGKKPATAPQIAHELEIPIRLAHDILYELVEAAILIETAAEIQEEVGYNPARAIDCITVGYVIDSLEHLGFESIPVQGSEALSKLSNTLKSISDSIQTSPTNIPLKDI